MSEAGGHYFVFGGDRQTYGPANVELLQDWAKEGAISAHSAKVECTPAAAGGGVRPGQLRRLVLFADMAEDQLEKFVGLLEKVSLPAFRTIVKKGEHGDAMFLVLVGEARVVDNIDGAEKTLHTLEVGDFFGEVSLFDEGPRTANVMTNKDSTFLKISKSNFNKLVHDHPGVAAAFLTALARFMAARLRSTNKMYSASLLFGKAGEGQIKSPQGINLRK
jgi:signal-transduction protein with cAMP-binding, CBS, and nucleotidyltransferase domain